MPDIQKGIDKSNKKAIKKEVNKIGKAIGAGLIEEALVVTTISNACGISGKVKTFHNLIKRVKEDELFEGKDFRQAIRKLIETSIALHASNKKTSHALRHIIGAS